MPMLYHGSHEQALPRIQRDGILPRAKSKGRNNWDHTVTSNRDAVYLTDAYAWHFASAACNKNERGLIFEINRDFLLPWLLCPDEDFLEQASRKVAPSPERPYMAPLNWSMKKRTLHYRKVAKFNPTLADKSLEHMGTAGYYGPVPWQAITRYVLIDWNKMDASMHMRAVDSMVSTMNYLILQDRHRALTRWFFGDPVTAEELNGFAGVEIKDEEMGRLIGKQADHTRAAIANRSGLTVVNCNHERVEV
jgi:hypothetical protein